MERQRNLIISGRSRPVVGYFRDGQPVVDKFDPARSHIHYPANPVERANFEGVLPRVIAEIQPQPDDKKSFTPKKRNIHLAVAWFALMIATEAVFFMQ